MTTRSDNVVCWCRVQKQRSVSISGQSSSDEQSYSSNVKVTQNVKVKGVKVTDGVKDNQSYIKVMVIERIT